MPGTVIGTLLKNGYAGTVSRTADAVIQNRIAAGTIDFGQAVQLTGANKWALVDGDTTAALVAGIAVREVVQANTFDPQSNPSYVANVPCDAIVRGQVAVHCQRGTPAAGAAVYVRTVLNGTYPTCVVGGFEASSDTTNSVQVTNIEWSTGVVDANNIAEVTIKSRAKG